MSLHLAARGKIALPGSFRTSPSMMRIVLRRIVCCWLRSRLKLFEFPIFADQPSADERMQIADFPNLVAGRSVDAVGEIKPSTPSS